MGSRRRSWRTLAVCVLATTAFAAGSVVADAQPARAAAGNCQAASPLAIDATHSSFNGQGSNYSLICNYARTQGTPSGAAITIEYACPKETEAAWKSKTASPRSTEVPGTRQVDQVMTQEQRSITGFINDAQGNPVVFTLQERLFFRVRDDVIATIVVNTYPQQLQAKQLIGLAQTLTDLNDPKLDCAVKPLCPEATKYFGADRLKAGGIPDPTKTGILVDQIALYTSLTSGLARYNLEFAKATGFGPAFNNNSNPNVLFGTAGAAFWLFAYGGTIGTLTQGTKAEKFAEGNLWTTGQEAALHQAMLAYSQERSLAGSTYRLSTGDVLYLSLKLHKGALDLAFLGAHNTLRSLVRDSAGRDTRFTKVAFNAQFEKDYLVHLRRNPDNGGPSYHLWGTAYFETVSSADWGPYAVATLLAYSSGLFSGGTTAVAALPLRQKILHLIVTGLDTFYGYLTTKLAGDTSPLANWSNQMEQAVREGETGGFNAPDPEKFCFNFWGAVAGSNFYEQLPGKLNRNNKATPGFTPGPKVIEGGPSLWNPDSWGSDVLFTGSPYSIDWQSGQDRMRLDQGKDLASAEIYGYVPMVMVPQPEDDSWAAWWIPQKGTPHTVTLEATRAGAELHLMQLQRATGKGALYETTAARAGDRYEVTFDGATLGPAMRAPDGSTIKPQLVGPGQAASSGQSGAAGGPASSGSGGGAPVGLFIVIACAAAAGFFVLRSKTRPRSLAATAGGASAPQWATHYVPAEGASTWTTPDPSALPSNELDPWIEVKVLEFREDGWARIECSNAWTAWVDGRVLLPIDQA